MKMTFVHCKHGLNASIVIHIVARKYLGQAEACFHGCPKHIGNRPFSFFKLVADALTLFKVVCLLSVVCRLRLDSVFDVIILYEDFQV